MKDITTEEAVEMLNKFITEHKLYNIKQSDGLEENIEKVLNELEKKDKIIDAMTEYIDEINYIDDNECEFETKHQIECPPTSCKDCIKQYFEQEVKDE